MIPELHIEDYNYPLTDDRIAKYPLAERDSSKLLRYEKGGVKEYIFRELPSLLPENAIMVFNDTKVVPARLHFQRPTGAHIEIFCLEPVTPNEYNLAFAQTDKCVWKCVIGNAKRWKDDILSLYIPDGTVSAAGENVTVGTNEIAGENGTAGTNETAGENGTAGTNETAGENGTAPANEIAGAAGTMGLKARLIERDGQTGLVEFSWEDGSAFSRVLEVCGSVPIPPYLNRETESIDLERYQTLYAHIRGSVAAPTAGLHFTEDVLGRIRGRGIDTETVCLHVGAGTFLPVKSSNVAEHSMHREPFVVSKAFISKIASSDKKVIAVGTTSVRTLESLYYIGVSIIETGAPVDVAQWAPYEREYPYSTKESLEAIVKYLDANNLDSIVAGTRIIIVPGFRFRIVDNLVTNFHQPESTLILLVSAFVGGDWRTIYDYALANGFRFLSYGDSSLLVRAEY